MRSRGFQRTAIRPSHQRMDERSARMATMMEQVRRAPKPSITMEGCTSGTAIVKEQVSQSGPYMLAAKGLGYCMRCNVQVVPFTGQLDFCHADLGKGEGFKTDVRLGWPGCRFCHEEVGRKLPKPVRRAVEWLLGVMTRAAVLEAGTWPKRLAKWSDQ